MDSTDIRIFLEVARSGNVSTAALAMYITQSALSKRLKKLEEALGVDLVIRGKGQKGVELTPAGIEFLELAHRWQGLWQDMRSLRSLGRHQALNVGVLDSVQPLTVRLSSALYQQTSSMRLRFSVRSSGEMYDEVDRRGVDVGFSNLERQRPSVRRSLLFSEPFVALCVAGYQARDQEILNPGDLDPDTEVFTAWWSPGYLAWHESHWEMHRSRRLSTSSIHLQLAFLGVLGQWAIMPYSLARRACDAGSFTMHRLKPEPPLRICHLLTHKQTRSGVKDTLKQFTECLDTILREEMPWMVLPDKSCPA